MSMSPAVGLALQAMSLDSARNSLATAAQQAQTANPAVPAQQAAVVLELSAAAQSLMTR